MPQQSGRAYQGSENAVQVKQGRRAGTGTVRGREQRKGEETYIVPTKRKAAELRQQSGGSAHTQARTNLLIKVYQVNSRKAMKIFLPPV